MKVTQHPEEFEPVLEALREIGPKTILEVGIDWGGTLVRWCELVGPQGLVIGVDRDPKTAEKVSENCGESGQAAKIIIGDSMDPETLAKVKGALDGRPVDFLFIDGDHSYAGVKEDYETYSPLVAPGGVIAFHDIVTPAVVRNSYRKGTFVGVGKFWKEFRARDKMEFIYPNGKPKYGIGVIIKND